MLIGLSGTGPWPSRFRITSTSKISGIGNRDFFITTFRRKQGPYRQMQEKRKEK